MSRLENLATFIEVARAGSFSAAARQLKVPRSTVSCRIANLEEALNVRLLKRSTRSLSLTADGEELYCSTAKALAQVSDCLERVGHPGSQLRGTIRLAVPSDLPQNSLVDAVTSFRQFNREVRFEIRFSNEVLDLVRENIDLAIRIGVEEGSEVVRRKVLDFPCGFFAHRDWLHAHGEPPSIAQARDLMYSTERARQVLGPLKRADAIPAPSIDVNSFAMTRGLVLRGSGIGLLPTQMLLSECREGLVRQVLQEVPLAPVQMHLSFATRADMTPRVRAFTDHLTQFMEPPPEPPPASSAS